MTQPLLTEAKIALDQGDHARAVALYERAMLLRPELSHVYRFNLERARALAASNHVNGNSSKIIRMLGAVYLDDLYKEVLHRNRSHSKNLDRSPLVSVVVTTHNVENFIEQALTSLLFQTHKPLEVIVVDDNSSDNTWSIIKRVSREYPIVIKRLNANLGTYFAKNVGVQLATGDFIFFQDGDDLSHPKRIELCLPLLNQSGVACVQGAYSRLVFPEGRVLSVSGSVKKLGLITIGLRRTVFDEIGYFNCTTKASDDEFFQRLQTFYKSQANSIKTLDLPLYYANFQREGSLSADMFANSPAEDGAVEQKPSLSRALYVESFQKLHATEDPRQFKQLFKFPAVRDIIPVQPEMTMLANATIPIVASLCSIPERETLLKKTLDSLVNQVDEVHIYLDHYDVVPEFLKNYPKITIRTSQQLPGLRDNAKFLPLLDHKGDCYFFTVDDDINYPADYVNAMIKKIDEFDRLAVVGVHGVIIPEWPVGYFSGFRRVYGFRRELEKDCLVNNLGTGTVAFYSGFLKGIDYRNFIHSGMVDLYLSVFCKNQGVPMVAVARPENWLEEMQAENDQDTCTLFDEGSKNDQRQSLLVKQHAPWGFKSIIHTVDTVAASHGNEEVINRLKAMLPILPQCLM